MDVMVCTLCDYAVPEIEVDASEIVGRINSSELQY